MKPQYYIIKKYVKASTAAEALALEPTADVLDVYTAADKPREVKTDSEAVGFKTVESHQEEDPE